MERDNLYKINCFSTLTTNDDGSKCRKKLGAVWLVNSISSAPRAPGEYESIREGKIITLHLFSSCQLICIKILLNALK